MLSYAWRDLVRNPCRTGVSLVGIVLGVGLFCAVLFFADGSGATMTRRAVAPLSLDMQRVLTSPLGGGLALDEQFSSATALRAGKTMTIRLTVTNPSATAAKDVVVNDEPPKPLIYVAGTTRLNGRPLPDKEGHSPLEQGSAGAGLGIGTVASGATVRLTYEVRSAYTVGDVDTLRPRGSISSRDTLVPIAANAPRQWTLDQVRASIRHVPGVASADALSFVDLPPGSLRAGGRLVRNPLRVFAFDREYQAHYRSIRVVAGSFARGSAVVSAETARILAVGPGDAVDLTLPGRPTRLSLPVGGVVDLAGATPLFASRKARKLEDFLYVPNSLVVSPSLFERVIVPAFREQSSVLGTLAKSLPTREVDVLVDRSRLDSDPARALAQTRTVARLLGRIAPHQDYLIDNISNSLQVARDDATVGKQMFLFLGLPAVVLSAFLVVYAGSVLAGAQRRELAILRIRGAHQGPLRRMLLYRTLGVAGVGSTLGGGLGFVAALAILGRDALLRAAPREIAFSALVGIGGGMLTTALALWATGRRSLRREIAEERRELILAPSALWRRQRLELPLLTIAAVAMAVAIKTGAFNPPRGSVKFGRAVSLPSYLLLAPLLAWTGATLLCVRILVTLASRLWIPAAPHFGPILFGTVARSLRRRSWSLATGIAALGLVVAFGTSLAIFTATYETAKANDARFAVGADMRVTPSVLDGHPPGAEFAAALRVPGVLSVSPVVFKLENSVLVGRANQARTDLAAIDATTFARTATLADSFFVGRSAASALAALQSDPRGLMVEAQTAADLSIEPGDTVRVLLAIGTKHQALRTFHVVALFTRFPGLEQPDLVANLRFYATATHLQRIDFFLVRTVGHGATGLTETTTNLSTGPGSHHPIRIDSTLETLAKDQSSLTALDVTGLLRLDLLFTLPMSATAIAILVFGLMLQRRREYVTMRAHGMQSREILIIILAEAAFAAFGGVAAGLLVGTGTAYLLVRILQPLFLLTPDVTIPAQTIATLAASTLAGTLVLALAAALTVSRLRATEILRET